MANEETSPERPVVAFDYLKSNYYRIVHADGAYGGVTPRGLIHMSLYSERNAIPQRVEVFVEDDHKLGAEKARLSRGAVVRELEVGVTMDLNTAKALQLWLGEKIAELETALAALAEESHE